MRTPELETDIATLQQQVALEREQRLREMARHKRVVQEAQWLRAELSIRDAEQRKGTNKAQSSGIDASPAVRMLQREETDIAGTLLTRLLAALVLRYARKAARDHRFAQAEILYQAILLFRPRGFLWRQIGNMQAAQGIYAAAVENFRQAIAVDRKDAEAHLALGQALRQLDRPTEAEAAFNKALELDKRLLPRIV